jgi:hypothetical protein
VLKITNINQSLVESENGPRNLVRAIFHSYPSIIFLVETCEQIGRQAGTNNFYFHVMRSSFHTMVKCYRLPEANFQSDGRTLHQCLYVSPFASNDTARTSSMYGPTVILLLDISVTTNTTVCSCLQIQRSGFGSRHYQIF